MTNFQSSKKIDVENFANILMVFMEHWIYGCPDSAVPEVLSPPLLVSFILCVGCFTLHGQNDQEASFLSPMNSKHNSYTTLDEYSVCTTLIIIPWKKKSISIRNILGLGSFVFNV